MERGEEKRRNGCLGIGLFIYVFGRRRDLVGGGGIGEGQSPRDGAAVSLTSPEAAKRGPAGPWCAYEE